ncbi:MAG: hypothetical protein HYV07_21335 [Deltaproteobacteria bacterium]|nr:hypothetical protein [Deltaproteobacteria bacterium]
MSSPEIIPTHGIVRSVMAALTRGPEGLELTATASLAAELGAIPEKELPAALSTLVAIAAELDRQSAGCPAGHSILTLAAAQTSRLATYLGSGSSPVSELAARKRRDFARLTGGAAKPSPRAPRLEARRAPGKSARELFRTHIS